MKYFFNSGIFIYLFLFISTAFGATTISVGGARDVCGNGSFETYTVTATSVQDIIIDVAGGLIALSSIDVDIHGCPNSFQIQETDPNDPVHFVVAIGGTGCNNVTVVFDIAWTASSTSSGEIRAKAEQGFFGHDLEVVDIDILPWPIISGASGFICRSTTSLNYSVYNKPPGETVTWTTSSTGTPLSPSTATGNWVTFSGFTPNNMYSINAQYQCSGGPVRLASVTVITGAQCAYILDDQNNEIVSFNYETRKVDTRLPDVGLLEDFKISDQNFPSSGEKIGVLSSQPVSLQIFPNPLPRNTMMNVQLPVNPDNETYLIRIMDTQGRLVKTINTTQEYLQLNTESLGAGIYFLNFASKKYNQTRKFVVLN